AITHLPARGDLRPPPTCATRPATARPAPRGVLRPPPTCATRPATARPAPRGDGDHAPASRHRQRIRQAASKSRPAAAGSAPADLPEQNIHGAVQLSVAAEIPFASGAFDVHIDGGADSAPCSVRGCHV